MVFEDLLGLHACWSKIHRRMKAQSQSLPCQPACTHPVLGCCPRSQLKPEMGRVPFSPDCRLIWRSWTNRTASKQTKPKQERARSGRAVPTRCTTATPPHPGMRVLCTAVARTSLVSGQALLHPVQVPGWSHLREPSNVPHPPRGGVAELLQQITLWTKLVKNAESLQKQLQNKEETKHPYQNLD